MKVVVLAAGMGRRIGSPHSGKPKPLKKVLGLSLIERVILTTRESGLRDFVVVVGYLGEKVKETLGDGKSYGINVTYVENSEWERGNGVSLLKAKDYIDDRFILIMGDHLFVPEMIEELLTFTINEDEAVLIVDSKPASYIDLQDATKVRFDLDKKHIKHIGKHLKNYDGLDCGIFLCGKNIFETLEEEVRNGRETISDTMGALAERNKLLLCDSKGRFWIDIDTEMALKIAEDRILKGLIKPTDGFVSRYINRPISLRISRRLVNREIKPDMISLISFFVSLLSAVLLALGNYVCTFIGGILVQFSSILDGCDGEVARLKFQASKYGAWFDAVLDRYSDSIIIMGIVMGLYHYHGDKWLWIFGYLALMGTLITSYTATKFDTLLIKKRKTIWRFGRDFRMFIIMIGAILNEMYYLLILLAFLSNVVSIRRLYLFRELPET